MTGNPLAAWLLSALVVASANYIDEKQLDWLDKQLADSGSDCKICFFHHPLYSSGETHGSAMLQREKLRADGTM